MGDWIGHGATPNNWRSLGTDVDSGQKSSVTSVIQCVHWALAPVGPRERWDGFGKMLFWRGGERNRNKHHLLNLTSSF